MRYTLHQAAGVKFLVVRMQPETSTSKESDDEAKRRSDISGPLIFSTGTEEATWIHQQRPGVFFIQRIQIETDLVKMLV